MTRDDIIRLAREAAEVTNTIVPPEGPLFVTPFIERFAALVAAAEREALKQQKEIVQCMCGLCNLEQIEYKQMVAKGTKAWADTPDNWVDELRND